MPDNRFQNQVDDGRRNDQALETLRVQAKNQAQNRLRFLGASFQPGQE